MVFRASTLTSVVALAALLQPAATVALQPSLDRRGIEQAIVIGQSSIDNERARFHEAYRVPVGVAPLDALEVVTPFRQVVIAAEQNARRRGPLFGQRDALLALGAGPDRVDVVVELTFSPLNVLLGVPDYTVEVREAGGVAPVALLSLEAVPRNTVRVRVPAQPYPAPPAPGTGVGGGGTLLGATLIVGIATSTLRPDGRYELRLLEGATELARAEFDLAGMR